MLSRGVPGRMRQHGAEWAWKKIAGDLAGADLRFCNLECAATDAGLAVPKRYSFRADPRMTVQVLRVGGFNLVSLANNHTWDYGATGLANTLAALHAAKIPCAGAGTGRAGAIAPVVVTRHGLKIALVAYSCWTPEGYLPDDHGPSVALADEKTFTAELRRAKLGADLLVVSMHWGMEYARTPTPLQRRLAHAAIDAGADLVLGHHPHVAQPVEIYHGRPIIYSMGNCLFDRTSACVPDGLLVRVRLSPGHVTVERQMHLRIEAGRPVMERN